MTSAAADNKEQLTLEEELTLNGVHGVYKEFVSKKLAPSSGKGAVLGKIGREGKDRAAIVRCFVEIAEKKRKEHPLSADAARERREACERSAKYIRKEIEDRAVERKMFAGFPREEKKLCAAIEQMKFYHVRGFITPFSETRYTPSVFHRTWFKLAQEPGRSTICMQSASYDEKTKRVNVSLVSPTTIAGYEFKAMSLELHAQRQPGVGDIIGLCVSPREPSCFGCASYWTPDGVRTGPSPSSPLDRASVYVAPPVKRKPVVNPEEAEEEDDDTPITQLKRPRVGEYLKPSE